MTFDPERMFSPIKEITPENREYFAGRTEDFKHAIEAVSRSGAGYALAGEGGVGKTSFALQLKDILQGETSLLDLLGVRDQLSITLKRYDCAWIRATSGLDDVPNLLVELMHESDKPWSLFQLFPKAFRPTEQPQEEITREYGLGGLAKAQFKSSTGVHDEDRRGAVNGAPWVAQVHREFQNLLARIRSRYPKRELVIFIDDFHRLKNREGMGSLIKDTDDARFVIVAIADDISEIIRESPGRKLEGSKRILRPMPEADVLSILNRAEKQSKGAVRFAEDYRKAMVEYSEGYPWLVQMIGYHSVLPFARTASKSEPVTLSRTEIRQAVLRVASPDGDDERYQQLVTAIGTSPTRERILFALAEQPYGWIDKKTLKTALGEQARGIDSHLQQLVDRHVLKRDNDGRVRFFEPLLRAVVRFARERQSILVPAP